MFKFALAAAAATVVAIAPVGAVAFQNGSFEDGVSIAPGSFVTLGGGDSTSITGWTVGAGGVDYIGTYWQASEGSRSVDLSALSAGSLSQTFDTIVNQVYRVTFDLSGNPDGQAPQVKTLVTSPGGGTFSYDRGLQQNTSGNMKYQSQTFLFTALGSSTTLSFLSSSASSGGPVLDNVSVASVPEPLTWGMMVVGFGAMGAAMRRRRPEDAFAR